jgi:hypothetical protein
VPERWLLSLADAERTQDNLPPKGLELREVVSLCALADFHGVLPAVFGGVGELLRSEPDRLLADGGQVSGVVAALDPVRRRLAERSAISLFLGAESRKILARLRAAGVDAVALKGADFAARLYAPPALRPFMDVDLLVRDRDWERVAAVMSQLGYLRCEEPMKHASGYSERTWEHPAMPGAKVEAHDNLVNSPTVRRGVSVGLDDLPLEAGPNGERRLTPAGLLVAAAVHGAASHSFDKVQHLCDLAQIARGRAGPLDEPALRQCLAKTGAGFSVALGLDLTARALNAGAAADLLSRLELRWPRALARRLVTPALVARSQGQRRRGAAWRRRILRQMLKRRR